MSDKYCAAEGAFTLPEDAALVVLRRENESLKAQNADLAKRLEKKRQQIVELQEYAFGLLTELEHWKENGDGDDQA